MKKISTLGFGILLSLASFANGGPGHSAVTNIKSTVAGDRFDRHPVAGKSQAKDHPMQDAYNNKHNDGRNDDHGYSNNRNRYGHAISNEDFFAAGRVMDRENDNGRLLYAERIADDNYLTAEQVKELARFFSFDSNRFDFVKYAYSKTTDKNNFSVVCSAFSSNDGRSQLLNFVKACR